MPTQESNAKGGYVEVNGTSIYYEEYGSGPPLLMLHGGAGTAMNNWKEYIPLVSKHFRMILPDSRGHGKSNNSTGDFSYALMAKDMVALLKALEIDHPFICGYSDGGQIALEIGMNYPELPKAMLVGAAWYKLTPSIRKFYKQLCLLEPGVVDFERLEKEFPTAIEMWEEIHKNDWQKLIIGLSDMWYHDLNYSKDDFAKIISPTLILQGDRDKIISVETTVEMFHMLPNGKLSIIPDAGHSLPLDQIEQFSQIIIDTFTARVD